MSALPVELSDVKFDFFYLQCSRSSEASRHRRVHSSQRQLFLSSSVSIGLLTVRVFAQPDRQWLVKWTQRARERGKEVSVRVTFSLLLRDTATLRITWWFLTFSLFTVSFLSIKSSHDAVECLSLSSACASRWPVQRSLSSLQSIEVEGAASCLSSFAFLVHKITRVTSGTFFSSLSLCYYD